MMLEAQIICKLSIFLNIDRGKATNNPRPTNKLSYIYIELISGRPIGGKKVNHLRHCRDLMNKLLRTQKSTDHLN